LESEDGQMINLMDYQNQPYYCGGVRGQAGHGTAEGCSSLFTGSDDVCTNELHFYHNSGKIRKFRCDWPLNIINEIRI